jgi:hypothetical protein
MWFITRKLTKKIVLISVTSVGKALPKELTSLNMGVFHWKKAL